MQTFLWTDASGAGFGAYWNGAHLLGKLSSWVWTQSMAFLTISRYHSKWCGQWVGRSEFCPHFWKLEHILRSLVKVRPKNTHWVPCSNPPKLTTSCKNQPDFRKLITQLSLPCSRERLIQFQKISEGSRTVLWVVSLPILSKIHRSSKKLRALR